MLMVLYSLRLKAPNIFYLMGKAAGKAARLVDNAGTVPYPVLHFGQTNGQPRAYRDAPSTPFCFMAL